MSKKIQRLVVWDIDLNCKIRMISCRKPTKQQIVRHLRAVVDIPSPEYDKVAVIKITKVRTLPLWPKTI